MKHELSLKTIERGLNDSDWRVRAAAMNAYQGKDVPIEVIERGLKDRDWDVREAAMNACQGKDVKPLYRSFEPPAIVYKKCLGDVIVAAQIPEDAEIRGKVGAKCRTNKAVITEIIGDFCGEKVGISIYDKRTMYFVGDEIEVVDFDYSDRECSTGFHFFCSIIEAKNYDY